MEEKFCVICGKKINNPRKNSKTCCDPECFRKNRIKTTREGQIKRAKEDPHYIEHRNRAANLYYHSRVSRVTQLEKVILGYKATEFLSVLKDKYFAGGCGGENLDALLEEVKSVIVDTSTIDEAIEKAKDAGTI